MRHAAPPVAALLAALHLATASAQVQLMLLPEATAPLTKRSGRGVMFSNLIDWDRDGDLDLLGDQRIYDNIGANTFRRGALLPYLSPSSNLHIADLNNDRRPDLIIGLWARAELAVRFAGPDGSFNTAPSLTLATPAQFASARPAAPGQRSSPLTYTHPFVTDWNGDGLPDLLVGTRDIWSDYFPYLPARQIVTGRTSFGQLHGELYFLPNRGTPSEPRFPVVEPLRLDGHPLSVFGICGPAAIDWDNDGDLDLLVTQEAMPPLYFENTGTTRSPQLKRPVELFLDYPGIYSQIRPVDWNHDGLFDLFVSSEDADMIWLNRGGQGQPYFAGEPTTLREQGPPLWVPGFATPRAVDFDSDGDLDIVTGSDDGDFRLFRNAGGNRFAAAGELLRYSDGTPLLVRADLGWQPQGPVERFWGYTSPVPIDWDGDGDLDLLSGQIGRHGYLFFERGAQGEWKRPVLLEAAGRVIRTTGHARMRPAPVDWNRDGRLDLVAVNDRYEYTLFLRRTDGTLAAGAPLRFAATAKPVAFADPATDNVGRRDALNIVDWDGDGDYDIVTGVNSSTAGFLFVENTGKDRFAPAVEFTNLAGAGLRDLARAVLPGFGHTPNLDVIDWNGDGVLDLLCGQDMGYTLFFDGSRLKPAPVRRKQP